MIQVSYSGSIEHNGEDIHAFMVVVSDYELKDAAFRQITKARLADEMEKAATRFPEDQAEG